MVHSMRDIVAAPPPPSVRQLQQIRAADPWACRQLIEGWETPIAIMVVGYAPRRSDLPDLQQVGRVAVYQAALRYRPSRGFPFGHYAKRAIKNNVLKHAARLVRQRQGETSLFQFDDDAEPATAALLDDNEDLISLRHWLAELGEPHATTYRLLYAESLSQRDAAVQLGISQPRVAQLHRSLLDYGRTTFLD
jgi:RNA polymerase sigma factor (sigma-70 family)